MSARAQSRATCRNVGGKLVAAPLAGLAPSACRRALTARLPIG